MFLHSGVSGFCSSYRDGGSAALSILLGNEKVLFWNIDGKVGPGCPNKTEDVQLVQLAYQCKAVSPVTNAAERPYYAAVVPGAAYTGGWNDPLSVAIRTHQKSRGGTQDGRVSVIGSSSGVYGEVTWMLVGLNNNIRYQLSNQQWPRLDRHPQCPAALREAVGRALHIPM